MVVNAALLKDIPYFHGLDDAGIESVSRRVFGRKAEGGEIISFEGEPADVLYFVSSGVVKVFKTSADGKEQIFSIVRPGESFNDAPVFSNEINLASAEAMGPVVLVGIKKRDLENILAEYPQVALNVISVLSRRVQGLVALVGDFSFLHVTGRVAKMLLQYADHIGDARPRLTQQEMAALIGTAREMVGRSLKNLEEEGVIRMERNRIIIANQEALRKMAGVDA